jgi:type I restriction enzyme S subunit
MKFGLDENIIEKIIQVFEANSKVDKAFIVGSRAQGNYRQDSDIDIVVKGCEIKLDDIIKMNVAFEKKRIDYIIDLIDYSSIKEKSFMEHIDRAGIEIYSAWNKYKLGDIIKFGNGKERPKTEGNIAVFGGNGILGYCDQSNYNDETIIIGRVGAYCGSVFYQNRPIWVSDNALAVKPKEKFSAKFLYYFLQNLKLNTFAGGSSHPLVTQTLINSIDVLITNNYIEQIAITSILSGLDNKIDLLHRQNKTLELLAETLFEKWFIEETKENWEEAVLDKYVFFDPKEKLVRNNSCQFFEMKCLSNVDMNISEGIQRIISSASSFRNMDTLLAKITPCLENGKTGFVMHLNANEIARGSTEFIVMRSKGIVSPYWIYCLARNNDFRDHAILSMTGTSGRQRVQIDLLKSIKVKVDKSRMHEFHRTVDPFFKKIKSNQTQIRTITQLRDTLLPKLMTGDIRIKY